jgi:hypothetical protein
VRKAPGPARHAGDTGNDDAQGNHEDSEFDGKL